MSAVGLVSIMTSTIMAPASAEIATDLRMNNVESQMALSTYVLAIAFAPLLLSPLSEIYGRSPVFHSCNVWFLIWNTVCGFARSKRLLIAARFLTGLGASLVYAVSLLVVFVSEPGILTLPDRQWRAW